MSAPNVCLNCSAALSGPYCASCGQRAVDHDLSMREFLEDTTQELAHWEGKVPQSLKTLFLEPGRLTIDFLAGRRARWLPPLRLYLICSVAYFLSGALSESITHRTDREFAAMIVTNADGSKSITPEAREEIARGRPSRLFGYERMEHALVNSAQFHAITTLATLFATSTTVLAISGGVAMVYGAIYGLLALKRVFGDSWPRTIGKAAAVASVYMAGLFGASLVVIAITLALI